MVVCVVARFGAPRVCVSALGAEDAVATADRLPALINRPGLSNVFGGALPRKAQLATLSRKPAFATGGPER